MNLSTPKSSGELTRAHHRVLQSTAKFEDAISQLADQIEVTTAPVVRTTRWIKRNIGPTLWLGSALGAVALGITFWRRRASRR